MKKLAFILLIIPGVCFSGQMENINRALWPFDPVSTEIADDKLIVVMNEPRVTDKIYIAAINAICGRIWLGHSDTLDGVKQIIVLNKFAHLGYLFDGGGSVCEKMGGMRGESSKLEILGRTRTFTNR